MISKYSVRRPFTVVVAVILVLLLGFVSFTNMKTDLFPSMNLPYMVIVTTYIGATPEKVETGVTRPIEQAVASTSGVENVTSTSSENSSIVVVEFADGTNMDSALLEISGNIDRVKARLDDGVGDPSIIRINPDMLPILVASVDQDGRDLASLSAFVSTELTPQLESVAGVGSVSISGLLEESYRICLSRDKIDALNDRILLAVDDQLLKARAELDDAQKKLDEGRAEFDAQSAQQTHKLAEGAVELGDGKREILDGLDAVDEGIQMLQTQYETIQSTLSNFGATREGYTQLTDGIRQINDGLTQLANAEAELIAGHSVIGISMALSEAAGVMQDQVDQFEGRVQDAKTELDDLNDRLAGAQTDQERQELQEQIQRQESLVSVYETALTQAQLGMTQLNGAVGSLGETAQEILQAQIMITTQRDQLLVTLAQLNITKETTDAQLKAQYGSWPIRSASFPAAARRSGRRPFRSGAV
jgi:HAE1 family hydrophobic/amphiphilic exporter-1